MSFIISGGAVAPDTIPFTAPASVRAAQMSPETAAP